MPNITGCVYTVSFVADNKNPLNLFSLGKGLFQFVIYISQKGNKYA